MKDYPSIAAFSRALLGQPCVAFRKYDGSNLRVEWSKKQGWHKWGTRRRLFDSSDSDYGCAIGLFEKKYAAALEKALLDCQDFRGARDGAVVFMEFFGPHSFAGWHDAKSLGSIGIHVESNEPKDVIVFDVNINKRGLVGPRNFLKAFGHLDTPDVLYEGPLTADFIQGVRDGKVLSGEGVVCKGGDGFDHTLWMCKVKTLDYLRVLQERFGVGGWEKYWE